MLCKTAGTTSSVEPILEANAVVGQEINDGSVVWTVQNIRPTALDSYPVGSIYMSVNSTSPADLLAVRGRQCRQDVFCWHRAHQNGA